ncbi:hypothetical protein D3C76_1204100 [compost metagenome]
MDVGAVKKDLVNHSARSKDLQNRWVAQTFQDFWFSRRHRDATGFDERRECDIHGRVTQAEQDRGRVLDRDAVALLVVAV